MTYHDPFDNPEFKNKRPVGRLTFQFTDDWLIFATDENEEYFFANTELWPEWLEVGEKAPVEALRKYINSKPKSIWEYDPYQGRYN